jgi:type 1 glutamine amidotransferase
MKIAPQDRARAEEHYRQLTAPLPAPSGDEPRALVMIGDFYHHPAKSRAPLEAMLGKSGFRPQFLYDVKQLSAESFRGVRLLVVLRDGMLRPTPGADPVWWITDEQEKALAQFVERGGDYLALHCATALRWFGDKPCLYRDLLGSSNRGHGAENEKFEVRVAAPDHPITQGVHDFAVVDQHHRPGLFADNLTILLKTSGNNVHGYARTYGDGRICYLANGHHREVLESEPMQQLMMNASRWCSRT